MGKRVAEKGKSACYDKAPHCAAVQTHEDRTQKNHPHGFVRQGKKAIASFKQAVPLRSDLFSLQGEGKEEEQYATNPNPAGNPEPWPWSFEFA